MNELWNEFPALNVLVYMGLTLVQLPTLWLAESSKPHPLIYIRTGAVNSKKNNKVKLLKEIGKVGGKSCPAGSGSGGYI